MARNTVRRSRLGVNLFCLGVGAVGFAGAMSVDIESYLNLGVGALIAIGGGGLLVFLIGRSAWQSWLIHWEATRPIHPSEITWRPPQPKAPARDEDTVEIPVARREPEPVAVAPADESDGT
jgi:hypothetical protein